MKIRDGPIVNGSPAVSHTPDPRRLTALASFAVCCAAVYAVSWYVLSRPTDTRTLEIAATIDLTLLVPALFWFVVARPAKWSFISTVPVFIASLAGAALLLPGGREGALNAIEMLAAPLELALIVVVIRRVRRAMKASRLRGAGDVEDTIRATVRELVPWPRAAGILAFEICVLWFALFSWRTRPERDDGSDFTTHRKTGYGALLAALILAVSIEVVPIHALLLRASPVLAWSATALSLYGILWLVGDYRAIRLRPVRIDDDRLIVRFGLRWSVDIPIRQIHGIRNLGGSVIRERADLRLVLPGARRIAFELDRAVEARGPYGLRRRVRTLELGVDDPDRLIERLTGA